MRWPEDDVRVELIPRGPTARHRPGNCRSTWRPIRAAVLNWQEDGYPGITRTSRDLINHWTDEEACQPYFAQLDAVLTHIYLH